MLILTMVDNGNVDNRNGINGTIIIQQQQ